MSPSMTVVMRCGNGPIRSNRRRLIWPSRISPRALRDGLATLSAREMDMTPMNATGRRAESPGNARGAIFTGWMSG